MKSLFSIALIISVLVGSVLGPSGLRSYSMTCGITGRVVVDWVPVEGCFSSESTENSSDFHRSCCAFSMLEFKLEEFQSIVPNPELAEENNFSFAETFIVLPASHFLDLNIIEFADLPPPVAVVDFLTWIQVFLL